MGSIALALFFLPNTASAQLITCDGPECELCHFVSMGNNILMWLITIMFLVVTFVLIVAGFKLLTAAGSPDRINQAKDHFYNAFIGLVIVLAAWLLIDTVIRGITGGLEGAESGRLKGYGPWNVVECEGQPSP